MRKALIISGIIIGSLTLLTAIFGAGWLYYNSSVIPIGATITTIQGTDKISDSRSTINTNFANLNSDKMEVSTSSVDSITTLSNLVTTGTLTSGALGTGFTAVNVPQGGTSSTTLSANQVLLGNGTSGILTVTGFGTSGQFLGSNGAGSAPTWQSTTVNEADNYTWTGPHIFNSATTTFNATTSIAASIANKIVLNSIPYDWPGVFAAASSTVLSTNGVGSLSFNDPNDYNYRGYFIEGTTTDTTIADTTTETGIGGGGDLDTLPANSLQTTGGLFVKTNFSSFSDSGSNNDVTFRLKLGGTEVCASTGVRGDAITTQGNVEFFLFNDGSNSSQRCISNIFMLNSNDSGNARTEYLNNESTSSVDTSSNQGITATVQWDGNDGGETETITVDNLIINLMGAL